MKQILKRLELIKTAIDIDDEEIIELQIMKLKKIEIDAAVISILDKLENLDYGSAVLDIEEYLSRFSGMMVYEDKEAQGLKLELKALEKKLQLLSEQKREYLNDINEFNTLYHLKLGTIIQEILKLKKDLLEKEIESKNRKYKEEKSLHVETQTAYDEIQKKIEELEEFLEDMDEDDESYEEISQVYEELKENLKELEEELANQKETIESLEDNLEDEEFEKTKADYEEFHKEYEDIKEQSEDIYEINEDDKKELKKLYRKASRLCHPDIVVDKLKKQSHEIMQALNGAYSKKDLKTVQKILSNLENGISFDVASDKTDDKRILKAKIDELRIKIDDIDKEVETIKQDDIFETISELDDWDEYFGELKSELEKEKESLEDEARGALEKNNRLNVVQKNIKYIKIELTSTSYLNLSNQIRKRDQLFNGNIKDPKFALIHEKDNSYDDLAVKILCEGVFIGYILKYKNLENINNFCFKNKKLRKLDIRFDNGTFELFYQKDEKVRKENSEYSRSISNIENISFEKIRRYCNNIANDQEADKMQEHLAKNGKMYKALIHDALDQFLERLDGETITIIDWDCGQGIGSMLVLDYIREKQLDTKVLQVMLIDSNKVKLSRAMAQVKILSQNFTEIIAEKNDDILDTLKLINTEITFNLVANDTIPSDSLNIDSTLLKNAYFICISNEDKNFVDKVYNDLNLLNDCHDVSIRNCKIGRFEKFERIFKINFESQESTIDIEEDDIPF